MIEEVPKGAALLRGGNMSVCEGGREGGRGPRVNIKSERRGKGKKNSHHRKRSYLLMEGIQTPEISPR